MCIRDRFEAQLTAEANQKSQGDSADAIAAKDLIDVANIPQTSTSYAGAAAEGGIFGSGEWGIVGEEGPEIATGPTEITPLDQIRKLMNLVDNMAGGSSQNDDIQGSVSMTKDIQQHMLVTMNKALALAGMDPTEYEGKDMRKSPDFAALDELTNSAKLDFSLADDIELGDMSTPQVDIEPDAVEELDKERGMSTTEFAQRKAEDSNTLAEKIDQLIAVQTQGNAINEKAKNAAVETAETNQKIMQSSIV